MTKEEGKRAKQYLYSIKRTQLAIFNLERAIIDLDTKIESTPTWTSSPEACRGGQEGSKLENWAEFVDTYQERRSFLLDRLQRSKNKVEQYEKMLDAMNCERWGALGVQIVRHKYYQHISPDSHIYTMFLFCSPETFYRTHRLALQFVVDTIPEVMGK